MKLIVIILIILFAVPIFGQQAVTLQDCYVLAAKNYPLAKQFTLLKTQNEFDKQVVSNTKMPQLSFDAQATYQSDVIEIPIPNTAIQALNKDQYRATFSVNQLIYNGGAIAASLSLKSAQLKTKQQQVEVNLYQLKQQINQLYFSILLSQETVLLLKARQALLQSRLSEVKSGIKYGSLLPFSDKVLEVELLKLNQQFIEVENNKAFLIESLSSIIGNPLNASTLFENPLIETNLENKITRPELALFQIKKDEIESNRVLIARQNSLKLQGFVTGGYGNPGLNMLDNSFQQFYLLGVKLNYNVFDWNTNKKQQQSLSINKDLLDTEEYIFKLNTNVQLIQQQKEITKIEAFIISDLQIINLRKEVIKAADSQLKNGVITSSAYITELTNLYEDENIAVQHTIQLALAKANYNAIKGQ